jgi:hypothetical protein
VQTAGGTAEATALQADATALQADMQALVRVLVAGKTAGSRSLPEAQTALAAAVTVAEARGFTESGPELAQTTGGKGKGKGKGVSRR